MTNTATPTAPHPYAAEKSGWRTCAICGRGANAGIHRVVDPNACTSLDEDDCENPGHDH